MDGAEERKPGDAGAKLRRGDAAYRALLDSLPQKIFLKDRNSVYVLCNEAYARDLKLRPEELEGRTDLEFFPRELAEKYRADDKRTMEAGVPEEFDEEYVSGGERRIIHTVKTPVRDPGGLVTGVLGIFWDVTDSMRAQEALRSSEARLKSLFTQVTDLVLLLSVSGSSSPVIKDVSDSVTRLLGYSREELIGRPVIELDAELDGATRELVEKIVRERRQAAADGRSFLVRHRCKDGTVREFECAAGIGPAGGEGLVISVERDISERRKAEAELRESYEMQRALNEILQQSLKSLPLQQKLTEHLATLLAIPWLAVEPRGAIFLANGRSLLLTAHQGLEQDLLTACARLPFGKCLCGKAAEKAGPVVTACATPDHEITYPGMVKHGHYCAPIAAGGKVLGVLNLYLREGVTLTGKRLDFLKTVTDIIAADILHSRVEDQLVHSQKMDAVGHMAGGIAHDFNNILSAILGYSSFLRASIPAGDPKAADVEEILAASERAAELTRQLLAFSRKQAVQTELVDLDEAVSRTLKMVRRMVAEQIEFAAFLGSAPAKVLCNRGQIEQVLVNLTVNARDAMPGGGKLTFETGQVELGGLPGGDTPDIPAGNYVMLAVSDTGTGMPPEVVSRVFEPFFTTKEPGKGTGLGLATVYGIVKQSGGGIYVYSEPGKGTTFKLYFPAAAPGTCRIPEKAGAVACRGTETVLLVEDDEAVRRFVSRLLTQNGYTVLEAAAPKAALEICGRRKDIALLLTDMIMPQMNGYELAKAASDLLPGLKVLYMSGYTDNALARQNISEQGAELLEKPLNPDKVLIKLREALKS